MKCRATERQKQQKSADELFKFFLMICWVLNHQFGFGINRFKRIYDGLGEVNKEVEKYQSKDGDNSAGFDRLTQWGLEIGLLEKKGDGVCLK
jgi:hypothetical protein